MNYLFSIQDFANLSIENKRLEDEVAYYKQHSKDQECYIEALKNKMGVLEQLVEVKEKLIDKYEERVGLLKQLIDEKKCKCSTSNCECKHNKSILSKEDFVEIINLIKIGYEKRNKFSDALEEINEGWFICNLGEEWVNALIDLLCIVMNDKSDKFENNVYDETMIEWWLFADVDKKLTIKDISTKETYEVDISTPEKLYDYLIENY